MRQFVKIGLFDKRIRLEFDERRAVEFVPAGLGDSGDYGRTGLPGFGAEVLGFDLYS